jgi:hypothetical protein
MHSGNKMHKLEANKNDLFRELDPYISESGRQWFHDALQTIAASDQVIEDLGLYSAMAKRKLGSDPLHNATSCATVIDTTFSPLDIHRWSSADAARLILLMSAVEGEPELAENIILSYYKMGDESEHIALVRGLIFFAPGEYLTKLALDIGRTNNLEVLAALTLDNPYPACFYSEQAFNQMVLKALFLGLAIERIEGIQQRANPDLTRMCENYVVEREAAGRTVPSDIWLAIGPFASDTGRQQMIDYLSNENIGHRYYSSLALVQRLSQDPTLTAILKQHLDTEPEPMIRKLLQDSLQVELN